MQTLFNKKKKLIKQNNALINTFFINILLIILGTCPITNLGKMSFLLIKLFPFLNVEILTIIVFGLLISELFIVNKIDSNEKTISKIKNEIEKEKINKNKFNKDLMIESISILDEEKENLIIMNENIFKDKKLVKKLRK